MPITILTDSNFANLIGGSAALILISDGNDKLRSDFKTAFVKAADEEAGIVFAQVDPRTNHALSSRFDYQNKSLLIGWYAGEVLLRRSRPWASDLPGFISTMQEARAADLPPAELDEIPDEEEAAPVLDKPLNVSDADFEQEAILASHELAGAGGFLGGMVRTLPHGRSDLGEAGGGIRRSSPRGQGRYGCQSRAKPSLSNPQHPDHSGV